MIQGPMGLQAAASMKPGLPFDMLLNKDSKRKIQSVVAWKKDGFSTDTFNLASRFPSDSFSSLKLLQAVPFQSDAASYYTTISTADLLETSRKTVALRQSDGTEWSVEELIAMQLSYIKSLAETLGEEKVSDVIVTVPPYYSQFERDAGVDAIEISGLHTLALINDGTAVAVNYAMTRTLPKQEYHIIYDAGASSVHATIVSFSTDSSSKTDTPATHIAIAVGGTKLDWRLRELLVNDFVNKHKRDIRQDKRGMAKLWKEASRVKAILSTNTEAVASVENVAFDLDFWTKTACEDLKGKYTQPTYDALTKAGLSLNDITSAAMKAAVGEDKFSLNVNADEAAVLGAGLYGASLSRQFKTKNIKVQDIGIHDIQAAYFAAPASPNAKPRSISTTIFPAGSKMDSKKTLTLKRKEDFDIYLDYKTAPAPGFPTRILEVELSGVAEAIGNLTECGATDPVVKATLMLSESGFVSVTDAVAFGEIKDESITGKLKGLFGAGSSSLSDAETETESATEASSASEAAPSASASTASLEAKAEKVDLKDLTTIPLNLTVHFTSIPPMTVEEKRVAQLDVDEAAKNRKEEARNTLESYLYKLRDLLNPENRDTPFKECSQDSERAAIAEKLEETITWLHDKGDVSETLQFLDKRIALETLERPI
ncbi:actin-like ATPase domain-containing protein, partial [Armillaria solidipes]